MSLKLNQFFIYSTCSEGSWNCTTNTCKRTCSVYGIGHYETFDGQEYYLKGENEYTLIEVNTFFRIDYSKIFKKFLKGN